VDFPEGADKAVLNQIVGGDEIARQGPRVTRQTRDQNFDFAVEVSIFSGRPTGSLTAEPTALVATRVRICKRHVHNMPPQSCLTSRRSASAMIWVK
jgi:hypothetical protein